MKSKHLLTNKKIVIVLFAILLALIVIIAILVNPDSKEIGEKDTHFKTEQNKDDVVGQDSEQPADTTGKDYNHEGGLEVLKPNETVQDNSSNASGSWKDEEENTKPSEEDKKNNSEEQEYGKEILKDDITWGDIY